MKLFFLLLIPAVLFFGCKSTPEESPDETPAVAEAPAPEIDAATHFNRGAEHYGRHEFDEAVTEYSAAIAQAPEMAEAYIGRGNANSARLEFEEALDDYKAGAAIDPEYSHYAEGYAFLLAEDYRSAVAEFSLAIDADSNIFAAYNDRGLAYTNMGNINAALADFDTAIGINGSSAIPYNNRGNAYLVRRDYAKAIEEYTRAIELHPGMTFPYSGRGLANFRTQVYDKAIDDYTKAMELTPRDPFISSLYTLRGNAYSAIGDNEKAESDYAEAERLRR